MKVHSALAATTDGVPLGLLYQEVLVRDPQNLGKKHQRHKRDTKDKESQRWITALQASQDAVPEKVHIIVVADREADIYDLFTAPRRPGVDLLIRGTHNRRVNCQNDAYSPNPNPHFKAPNRKRSPKKAPFEGENQPNHLWDAARQSPIKGELAIQLHRANERPPRQAILTIRYQTLKILPPQNRRNSSLKPVPVQVVLAEEKNAPPRESPICWMLITTLPVTTLEEATQCIHWYSRRWLVERYHFVLKSGCRVEDLQLEKGERIQRALA
ncbi:MAG: IS4 family transposase, partial [Candidatus Jordarchaeaceae archaeon]